MVELSPLQRFVPENQIASKIDLEEDLHPIVIRLARRLPDDKIWSFFSSTPGETGGRIVFPYFRVDSGLLVARDSIYMLEHYSNTPESFSEGYQDASKAAFRALIWVEVGFEGLENLAKSPASINWTCEVGHFVIPKQRGIGIMSGGKQLYDDCLRKFADFRQKHRDEIGQDVFVEYESEDLLIPFIPNQA